MPAEPMSLPRCGCAIASQDYYNGYNGTKIDASPPQSERGARADVDRVPSTLVIRHNQRGLLSLLTISGRGGTT